MINLFSDIRTFGPLIFFAIIFRFIGPSLSVKTRKVFLILTSFWFLSRLGTSLITLQLSLVYIPVVYALAKFTCVSRTQKVALFFVITGLVTTLVLFKYHSFTHMLFGQPYWLNRIQAMEWIGLSYLTMRAIDYLVTAEYAAPENRDFVSLALYLSFFSSFVSGPIPRYLDFSNSLEKQTLPSVRERLAPIAFRIFLGVFKILFLGRVFYHASVLSPTFSTEHRSLLSLALGAYSYLLYIYFDFSGYCDCAISIAELFNLSVPENFNLPLFSSNLQEFWNRWHISLSQWCRDHIFFNIIRSSEDKFPILPTLLTTIIATFITFTIIGIWHGDSLNWLLYGLYHGAGISILLLYRAFFESRFPNTYERLVQNSVYRLACIFITFNFVSWGLLLTLGRDRLTSLLTPIFGV